VAPNEIMPNMLRNDESRATIDGNHVLVWDPIEMISTSS
jgi:hypothetical protein